METEDYRILKRAPGMKRFLARTARIRKTTNGEEEGLSKALKAGGRAQLEAQQRLVESHIPLVISIAFGFRGCGVSMEDLIQQGTLGLHRAAEKFDSSKGTFRTYAHNWVWQHIRDYAIGNSRNVRLPTHVIRDCSKIRKRRSENQVSDKALAAILDTDETTVRRIETATQAELSLDAPLSGRSPNSEGDGITFGEAIPGDDPFERIHEEARSNGLVKVVREALASLSARERDIILGRFAMREDDAEVETLEDLCTKYKLSRERIRQIQLTAMKKLREGPFGERLKAFLIA